MLKVGDKVRFSNRYLKLFGTYKHGKYKKAKQQLMTVKSIAGGSYDWRSKKFTGQLVLVDPAPTLYGIINSQWLRFVRR